MGYINQGCTMFSQLIWKNQVYTVSADGKRIFVQTHGDLIKADGNVPYENVYVYIFNLENEKITHIFEYANPVAFLKLMNLPMG